MTRTRAFVAAVLATLFPGLGHVYLRTWFRAFAWIGLWILTGVVVLPPDVISAAEAGDLAAVIDASGSLPTRAFLAVLAVRVLNVVDAAWLGLQPRSPSSASEGPTCPNCGRDLDTDLDFCHWCTTPLDAGADESTADSGFY